MMGTLFVPHRDLIGERREALDIWSFYDGELFG